MTMKNNRLGLSLLEIIISTAILVFLLGICALILHWAFNISSDVKARGNTGNEAVKSISWLVNDLSHTSSASVYMDKDGSNSIKSISFLSGIDESIDMEYGMTLPVTKWKNFVIYYLYPNPADNRNNLLIRKTFYDPMTYEDAFKRSIAEPLQSSDVQALCDGNLTLTNNNRIVARNVYELKLIEMDTNKNSCTICVTTRDTTKADVDVDSTYTTTVIMKNSIKQPL